MREQKRTTPRCILAQPWAQHSRRVLGTTRAEGDQAVMGGAEALAPNPIMIEAIASKIQYFCGSDRGDRTGLGEVRGRGFTGVRDSLWELYLEEF